ncbi:hypothetical protein EDD38_0075 [Kitasatospora cineracea]|uniref:Uncharacterized protein n=1 Tax=Kitasatospora cineracea TaxID=88074 RepID=A0A3N4REK3_9ACTN|nr:hypothetical protein EDD38_0075 [Kitasatospora cineracea]
MGAAALLWGLAVFCWPLTVPSNAKSVHLCLLWRHSCRSRKRRYLIARLHDEGSRGALRGPAGRPDDARRHDAAEPGEPGYRHDRRDLPVPERSAGPAVHLGGSPVRCTCRSCPVPAASPRRCRRRRRVASPRRNDQVDWPAAVQPGVAVRCLQRQPGDRRHPAAARAGAPGRSPSLAARRRVGAGGRHLLDAELPHVRSHLRDEPGATSGIVVTGVADPISPPRRSPARPDRVRSRAIGKKRSPGRRRPQPAAAGPRCGRAARSPGWPSARGPRAMAGQRRPCGAVPGDGSPRCLQGMHRSPNRHWTTWWEASRIQRNPHSSAAAPAASGWISRSPICPCALPEPRPVR